MAGRGHRCTAALCTQQTHFLKSTTATTTCRPTSPDTCNSLSFSFSYSFRSNLVKDTTRHSFSFNYPFRPTTLNAQGNGWWKQHLSKGRSFCAASTIIGTEGFKASKGSEPHSEGSAREAEGGRETLSPLDSLSPTQRGQIEIFVDSLLEWNQRMNLTAVTAREAVMERHIEDSLSLLPLIEGAWAEPPRGGALLVVDVGTGAGLPGLVLAIARPAWQVTLLESLRKRCTFLEHVVELLQLQNVTVQWERAELAGRGPLRESCHVAVARAVAELRVLAELCLPLVRVGGVFVAAKGPRPEEEVEAAKAAIAILGGSPPQLIDLPASRSGVPRTVVLSLKERATPWTYPRRAGTPLKKPL